MISFSNTRGILFFHSFIDRKETKSVLGGKYDSFSVVLPTDFLSEVFYDDDYLAINGRYVYYDEEKCDEVGLTNEERWACLAHELGHYYDETPRDNDSQIREMNADIFAIGLVPGSSLISAFTKLRNSISEGCRRDNIDIRIEKLKELISFTEN